MIALKSPYVPWLTQNSKWLPSKPAEITLISQWAQYWQYTPKIPARNVLKLCYFQHEKSMPPPLNWMDYLYRAIFKMAASEDKLRFRLLLRI